MRRPNNLSLRIGRPSFFFFFSLLVVRTLVVDRGSMAGGWAGLTVCWGMMPLPVMSVIDDVSKIMRANIPTLLLGTDSLASKTD